MCIAFNPAILLLGLYSGEAWHMYTKMVYTKMLILQHAYYCTKLETTQGVIMMRTYKYIVL